MDTVKLKQACSAAYVTCFFCVLTFMVTERSRIEVEIGITLSLYIDIIF